MQAHPRFGLDTGAQFEVAQRVEAVLGQRAVRVDRAPQTQADVVRYQPPEAGGPLVEREFFEFGTEFGVAGRVLVRATRPGAERGGESTALRQCGQPRRAEDRDIPAMSAVVAQQGFEGMGASVNTGSVANRSAPMPAHCDPCPEETHTGPRSSCPTAAGSAKSHRVGHTSGGHAVRGAGDRVCVAPGSGFAGDKGVVVVADADEHTRQRAGQGGRSLAGLLDGLPRRLHEQAVLGVDRRGLALGDAEEFRVESGDVVEEPTPARHRALPHTRLGVVVLVGVPAVGRNVRIRSSARSTDSHNLSGESTPPGSRHAMPMTATGVTGVRFTANAPLSNVVSRSRGFKPSSVVRTTRRGPTRRGFCIDQASFVCQPEPRRQRSR